MSNTCLGSPTPLIAKIQQLFSHDLARENKIGNYCPVTGNVLCRVGTNPLAGTG